MPFRSIVVGTDGSTDAHTALDATIDVVADDGVVHVVAAFDPPTDSQLGRFIAALPADVRREHDPTEHAQRVLGEAAARLRAAGVRSIEHLVDDEPASAILDSADSVDADLIVVGCRGLSDRERFRRGSVSDRVVAQARRSVLVVQP